LTTWPESRPTSLPFFIHHRERAEAEFFCSINASTSPMSWSGETLMGSWIRPWTWFLTRLTSESCWRSGML
jgi:hypothetical protein